MFTLDRSIGLFVPSTGENGAILTDNKHQKRVNKVSLLFADFFGGYSSFSSVVGGWLDESKNLITEHSVLVVGFCTEDAYTEHYSRILAYGSLLSHLWYQDTIGILDCFSKLHLITEDEYIGNVTRSISSRLTYHHLLVTRIANFPVSAADAFYNTGYTLDLALQEYQQQQVNRPVTVTG